jgi:hypothetical protein
MGGGGARSGQARSAKRGPAQPTHLMTKRASISIARNGFTIQTVTPSHAENSCSDTASRSRSETRLAMATPASSAFTRLSRATAGLPSRVTFGSEVGSYLGLAVPPSHSRISQGYPGMPTTALRWSRCCGREFFVWRSTAAAAQRSRGRNRRSVARPAVSRVSRASRCCSLASRLRVPIANSPVPARMEFCSPPKRRASTRNAREQRAFARLDVVCISQNRSEALRFAPCLCGPNSASVFAGASHRRGQSRVR